MSTPATLSITAPISISDEDFGTLVNTTIAALGSITLIDAEYKIGSQQRQVSILYYPGAGQVCAAASITARDGQDLDTLVNAYLAANPTFRPLRVFDTSPEEVRISISESVLLLYSLAPSVARPIVVRHTGAGIASGATGLVTALGTAGPTASTYTVRNMGDAAWGTNKEGYATFDAASGQWLAVAHCC